MIYIKEGKGRPGDETYAAIAQLPDIITKKTRELAVLTKGQYTAQEVQWASMVRGMAKLERDGDEVDSDGEREEGVGKPTDLRIKLSMKEFEDLQRAGEAVEDQDITADDEFDGEWSDSSGQENDGEAEADENGEEQDEEDEEPEEEDEEPDEEDA